MPFLKALLFAFYCTVEAPVLDLTKRCVELIFSKFLFLVLHIHSLILTPSLAWFCVASWYFQINWQCWRYLSGSLTVTLHHFQNVEYSYRFFSFHCILFLYWNSCRWLNLLHCSVKKGWGLFSLFHSRQHTDLVQVSTQSEIFPDGLIAVSNYSLSEFLIIHIQVQRHWYILLWMLILSDLLFNFVNYVFLLLFYVFILLCLCILILIYALFCLFCFHCVVLCIVCV